MGDNASDQDTFVSMDKYVLTPQSMPSLAEGADPDSHGSANGDVFLTEGVYVEETIEGNPADSDFSPHLPPQSSSQMEDHSAFMWNLSAPECEVDICATDEYEDTLEVSGDLEDTPDPSDLCGEFNTSAMGKKTFARVQKLHPHSTEPRTSPRPEDGTYSTKNRSKDIDENFASEEVVAAAEKPQDRGSHELFETESILNSCGIHHRRQENCMGPSKQTEEVFLDATRGIISSQIENPFLCPIDDSSPQPVVTMHSAMGPLSDDELCFWNSLAAKPMSPESLLAKRLIQTIQFQRKQVQDLKAAEIQIASTTLQSERRRHSEVEHERSVAIETLVEQLGEEGEQRARLEGENSKLRSVLSELQIQNEEVLNYFTQFDKDFTFSIGVSNALEAAKVSLEGFRRRDEQTIHEQRQRLEESEARLYQAEQVAEENMGRCGDLERRNEELISELRCSNNGPIEKSSEPLCLQNTISQEKILLERDSLHRKLREMELEFGKVQSALRTSRVEQNKVNEALLSMNVELEDAKRRANSLRKQRDSAERKHRSLTDSAASDRDRSYKFQNEMSVNFANAVNEIEARESQIRRLQNELDDGEKAFRIQASTVMDLQEQLQTITDAAIENSKANLEGTMGDKGRDKSVTTVVLKSMREEVSKAQVLLKERGEEMEGLRQQMQAKDELLVSVQLECTKLRTASSVRRMASRLSQGPSARMEQEQTAFLRRLSEKLRVQPNDSGKLVKGLSERIDILSGEKGRFEEVKKKLVDEVKHREHALHALRAEMAAEIATLKADVRHQETLRIRAQDDRKGLEKKYHDLLDQRNVSYGESFGDVTSSSLGLRVWSVADDSDRDSRRDSMYSTIRDEDGVRWKDPIIEGAVRSLNALIGTKDELHARNRELREKLDGILKNMGVSDEEGNRLRSLIMQSKEFQDELTRIVDMQQDILGNITGSSVVGNHNVAEDDTLPYLRGELNAGYAQEGPSVTALPNMNTADARGEAARFLREQLNETRTLCNEKLKVNVQLCGVISELKQEVMHLSATNHDLESTLSAVKDTHESFVSRLASVTGAELSIVAIEDCMRSIVHKVAVLDKALAAQKEWENSCTRKINCLVAQKHILSHIIDIYQSKYRLDVLTSSPANVSLRQRFRRCVFSVIAVQKMCQLAAFASERPPTVLQNETHYDVPPMAAIGKQRSSTISLNTALISVEAVPRLERAVVEKNAEINKLQETVNDLGHSLAVVTESARTVTHALPSSFVYKDDIMNRKNDMARRLRDVIQEKEDMDDRLSKEKQARIAAEARSIRYLDKLSLLKKKLGRTISNAESTERTYKAAIMYLKGKAEKANDDGRELDENVDPEGRQCRDPTDDKTSARKQRHAESRAVLKHELENAEMQLTRLEVGTGEYEKMSQYIKGLYGGIQRLGKPILSDHCATASMTDGGDPPAL